MEKSADAFRTISEVAEHLDTPAHVLRFWETRFPQIKPVKRAGGRRYYRPSDVALLEGIKRLLHSEGLTIRGVQKILREHGVHHVAGLSGDPSDEEVALEVALADIDTDPPDTMEPPAAEEATVTVLQDAIARMPAPPFPAPAQASLWDDAAVVAVTAADAPPPRPSESVEVPVGPTLAARLRARSGTTSAELATRLQPLHGRLVALRNRMAAAGHPGGL